MEWTCGYATEVEYVNDFNHALNPLWIDFCLTLAGVETRECVRSDGERLSYLELGFGMGNSLILNALTREGEFFGNDFMPSHIFQALKKIHSTQVNVHISEESFKEIKKCFQKENRQFDYIVLHGVWSWISKENQAIILGIIKECLKVGGAVYVSYNSFPGWEGKFSLRHLLKLYEENSVGGQKERITQSLKFSKQFFEANPAFVQQNPSSHKVNEELQTRTLNYLSHEFFNQDWHCCYFSEVAEAMQKSKCAFAGSAKLTWYFDGLTFSKQEKELLEEQQSPILKEQLKDYFLNESFRMDIFTKGNKKLSKKEREERLLETSFVLLRSPLGFQTLQQSGIKEICEKILEFFVQDSYRPKSLKELVKNFGLEIEVLLTIICAMMTQKILHPVQASVSPEIYAKVRAYNQFLFTQNNRNFLACALIGGGIYTDEVTWLALKGYCSGLRDKESLLLFLCEAFEENEQAQERIAEIGKEAIEEFLKCVPLYQTLGILE